MDSYTRTDGLHGSRRYVEDVVASKKNLDIIAMYLLDMVGDCDLRVTIPENSSYRLIKKVIRAAKQLHVRSHFTTFRGQILDDHQPFINAGIPAVDLIDFTFGSTPGGNEYWHTKEDNLSHTCEESLGIIGNVMRAVIVSYD